MKIKAIAAVCKKAKSIILYDGDEHQWVGDGNSAYALPESLEGANEKTMCAIFDIPVEKTEDYLSRRSSWPEVYSEADEHTGEADLTFDTDMLVKFLGKDLLPCEADGRVYFVQAKYIKPIEDCDGLRLTLRRTPEGTVYIAAKDGMFLQAVLVPYRPEPVMVSWLGDLYNGAVGAQRDLRREEGPDEDT